MKKIEAGKVIKWQWIWAVIGLFTILLYIVASFFPNVELLFAISTLTFMATALLSIFAILSILVEQHSLARDTSESLSMMVDLFRKNYDLLDQISRDVHLTETTKSIAYRETDRLTLGEAVLNKLHQKDFHATYEMIEAIENKTEYRGLALQLRKAADKYKNASEEERIEQIIGHIEKLADDQHWDQAGIQTRKLLRWYPDSAKAKAMPAKLRELKEGKKQQLLKLWQDATSNEDTDRSIELLKELDKYLTPSEGLAMQERVSEVFKAKIQILGTRFTLAVSDKKWNVAYETAQEIMKNFPNSKMAHEVEGKIEVLKEKAELMEQ